MKTNKKNLNNSLWSISSNSKINYTENSLKQHAYQGTLNYVVMTIVFDRAWGVYKNLVSHSCLNTIHFTACLIEDVEIRKALLQSQNFASESLIFRPVVRVLIYTASGKLGNVCNWIPMVHTHTLHPAVDRKLKMAAMRAHNIGFYKQASGMCDARSFTSPGAVPIC